MLTADRAPPWQEQRRGLLAVLVVVTVLAAYTWPLVDGAASQSFARADSLLRLAAVTAVGQSCLSAGWRHEGRDRVAMLLVAAGAQVWAVVQAVHLARLVLGRTGELEALENLGTLLLSGSAAVALWLLREPVERREAVRTAVEWALLAVSTYLLLRLLLPPFWSAGGDLADGLRAAAISVLLGGSLLTLARPGSTRREWPLLAEGLAVLAAALVAASLPATTLSPRTAGVLLTSGLALVALAVTLGGALRPPAAPPDGAQRPTRAAAVLWILPLSAVAAALPGLSADGRVEPVAVLGVVLVGLLAVAHGHLVNLEARSRVRDLAEAESRMRHRAFHDELTGLPNRALFLDRLTHALDLHRRHRAPLSVLYGDLDGFKQVNDQYGHTAGDALLDAVASRLRDCLRPEDTLARLGGDEFVLLLEHGSSPDVVAGRVRQVLLEPFRIGGRAFELRMSIGIARVDAESLTPSPQEVLDRADADMYARKLPGRGGPLLLAPMLPPPEPVPASEPELAVALARALHTGGVHVVYQPLVDAGVGTVHGMEALARWAHDGRVLLPEAFVGLAERFGLSGTLTDVVLEQSCAQLALWSAAAGHHRLTMAVNVTPSQISDPTLAQRVRGAVQRHGLQQQQVVVETTVAALAAATSAGVAGAADLRLSVAGFLGHPDDFALLTALPVHAVKMPRPRTAEGGQPDDDRLLHVLVALGREIDVQIVVERVERKEELAALRQLSGVLAQGYLLSRPADATTLDRIVLSGCPLPA